MDADEDRARLRARQLAAEAAATGDETGWFETLYREAEAGVSVVPWADGAPNPHLVEWFADAGPDLAGKRALVVGCGLGYDAEFLASHGFEVTAFDIAPSAITAAKQASPGSAVDYVTADLLDLPSSWTGLFDLVVEIYTVQPLYGPVRARALAALHKPGRPRRFPASDRARH